MFRTCCLLVGWVCVLLGESVCLLSGGALQAADGPGPAAAGTAVRVIDVADDAALRSAVQQATPGTHVRIAPGQYRPGLYIVGLKGTAEQPIVIEGSDANNPPLFRGGSTAWQLSRCQHVTLRNIAVSGQTGNGINIDDGGPGNPAAQHIVLERISATDIGPKGNRDAIKLSGVDDFVVRHCRFEAWAGQAVDMVGCHRGLIEHCTFKGKAGYSDNAGPQAKGGSSDIVIRRCLFLDAADRGVNLGGSTAEAVFRPKGAKYEAQRITVEGCVFVGCQAPVAFVGLDSGVVRYNTIYRPRKWVLRILQENTSPGFPQCSNGRFENNLIVFRRTEVPVEVNIGPNTRPESFRFLNNWWYCEDQPQASRPRLPAEESGGIYGIDPQLADPSKQDFRPLNPRAASFGADAIK